LKAHNDRNNDEYCEEKCIGKIQWENDAHCANIFIGLIILTEIVVICITENEKVMFVINMEY